MNWNEQNVVVTGACGFIGSHLVEKLCHLGANVTALTFYNAWGTNGWMDNVAADVKAHARIAQGDVRDAECMRHLIKGHSIVFHLAALIGIPYSYVAPRSYIETNVTGTLNILEAARDAETSRILITSTSEVYGTAVQVPIDESHPLQGQSPYSASKIAAEKITESYHKSFNSPAVIVRPFNTYGPRQSPRAVIPTIIMQLVNKAKKLKLGDPSTTRDFNFVHDTVTGLTKLAECDEAIGQTVNIGTGSDISIKRVAEIAQDLTGHKTDIVSDQQRIRPVNSEVRRLRASNAHLKTLTGWAPPARMEEGLKETIEWMKEDIKKYDSERYYI